VTAACQLGEESLAVQSSNTTHNHVCS